MAVMASTAKNGGIEREGEDPAAQVPVAVTVIATATAMEGITRERESADMALILTVTNTPLMKQNCRLLVIPSKVSY